MPKSKKAGRTERRKGALERLIAQKTKFETEEKKVPARIDREIERLEAKLNIINA